VLAEVRGRFRDGADVVDGTRETQLLECARHSLVAFAKRVAFFHRRVARTPDEAAIARAVFDGVRRGENRRENVHQLS
jgi:hypothetical protein